MRISLVAIAVLAATAGCGAADETSGVAPTSTVATLVTTTLVPIPEPPAPLVVVAEVGGCYMLGPNCATTVVMSDGTFGVFRNDPANVLDVPTSLVDADFVGSTDVAALANAIAATDFDELREILGPGECRACFDGIDYQVRFMTPDGGEDLSSVDHEFDATLDLFAELDLLTQVVQGSGALEVVPRGS